MDREDVMWLTHPARRAGDQALSPAILICKVREKDGAPALVGDNQSTPATPLGAAITEPFRSGCSSLGLFL